ncbi:Ubiquitin ligase-binding protein BUL1 [Candida viswanathii]|uniref:Ubiquitin ligase-binding protein BUL1 n=1 Tax=Candida viswanathii TaxID=5486 RepID=A0A367XYY9_9ASCO|nr:Ubiquitin ligase-binding protein BUL1 [Candida viswanathii]
MHIPGLSSKDSLNKAFQQSPSEDPPSYNESVSSSPISLTPQTSRSRIPTASNSSSSNSIPTTTKKKKNVPYRPAPEQQRQIDLLTNPSSSSSGRKKPSLATIGSKRGGSSNNNASVAATPVANITTVSSHAQTEYFDVLPSFQMFQSILKRDDRQFREDLSSLPPGYGDLANSSPTPPSLSPLQSRDMHGSTSNTIDEVVNRLNEYGLEQERDNADNDEYLFEETENRNELLPVGSHINTQVHNQNVEVTHETYGHSPLDNIDKLHKLPHSPIDIQIYVTKQVPQPNVPNELETRLKEYTSGDFVNGYITVTNTSDQPQEFGLFTVSLEGTIKEVERNPNATGLSHKFLKILMKKFLKMYDLNASYGYVAVPNSAGIEYEVFSNDALDGAIMGLPDDRILQPHMTYKKFFTFKFPHRLLDNACINSLLPHLLPPPSMGVDRTCFYNRGESMQLNKALGYGFLNLRGTPLLTRDYSFDDLSVSYTIEAKFIDRLNSKEPFSHDEINRGDQDSEYAISKSAQYFLRFIPDLKEQVAYCKKFHVGGYPVNGIGGKFLLQYLKKTTWRDIQLQNGNIEKEIDEKLMRLELTPDEMKDKNLVIHDSHSSDVVDVKKSSEFVNEPQERNYIYNKVPIEVFGKRRR